MAVDPVEQSTRRAYLDTIAALRTAEPAPVGADDGICTTIAGLDRILTHPFRTNTCTAFAEDAPLRIVGHDRRKILFGLDVLRLGNAFLHVAPDEDDLLELAIAAAVADRAIDRVINEQKFAHRPLGLLDLLALRRDDHA